MEKSWVCIGSLLLAAALQAREIDVEGRGVLIVSTQMKGGHELTSYERRYPKNVRIGGAVFPQEVPPLIAQMEYATHDDRDVFPEGTREDLGEQDDGLDTRTDEVIERVKADEQGDLLIAISSPQAAGDGWERVSDQSAPDFMMERLYNETKRRRPDPARGYWFYRHNYRTANVWVRLPTNPDPRKRPPFVFGKEDELRWANPLPLPNGVVISYGRNVCNPSMCILPNGTYLALATGCSEGALFASSDKGETWRTLRRQSFNDNRMSVFAHGNAVYVFGKARELPKGKEQYHSIIYRSTDNGETWSNPVYFRNVGGEDAPSHVDVVNGRIWKAFACVDKGIGAGLISAPADADLMEESNWTLTKSVRGGSKERADGRTISVFNEGTLLVTREGRVANAVKGLLSTPDKPSYTAASLVFALDKDKIEFDPEKDFALLPGASAKYTIRYDKASDRYWALTSTGHPRNVIGLYRSNDLRAFTTEREVLRGPSSRYHGFNYPHMMIDGDDIVFVSRTAWETARGCSYRWHDANMFTFHRIRNFRARPENVLSPNATIGKE